MSSSSKNAKEKDDKKQKTAKAEKRQKKASKEKKTKKGKKSGGMMSSSRSSTAVPTTSGSGSSSPATTSSPTEEQVVTPSPSVLATVTPGAPSVAPTTTNPTTDATPVPTASSTTPMPTLTGVPPKPTTGAPTTTAGVTPVPTAATPVPTASSTTPMPTLTGVPPKPTTGAPTTASATTPAPTVAGATSTPTTTTTPAPTNPTTCTDNPQDYSISIDLQIQYPNDAVVSCTAEEDTMIANNIQSALNANFPTTVPDWQGDGNFGPFVLDPTQEVDNTNGGGRRMLHDGRRQLQQGTICSMRELDCTADLCCWGCVTASTTDCGTSSLTNWVLLEDDVKDRLVGLNLPCLGIVEQLQVILLIDDPGEGTAIRLGSRTGRANDDPNQILLNSEGAEATEDDQRPTRTIRVTSELDFRFLDGNADPPSNQDMEGVMEEIKAFFTDRLQQDNRFDFVRFDVSNVSHKYLRDTMANMDTFELDFVGEVVLAVTSQQTHELVAKALSNYDFSDFIEHFVWESLPLKRNRFYKTKWVKFTSKHGAHGSHRHQHHL